MAPLSNLIVTGLMATAAMAAPLNILPKRTTCKLGAAYNDASLISLVSSACWAYNWGDSPGGTVPSGVEYTPMLWGTPFFDGWTSAIESELAAGATHIMGFNEADLSTQANLSPADAVTYYKELITPYKNSATLVTPSVTNGAGDDMGLGWMSTYLDICNGTCGQKVMNIHWYAGGTVESMMENLQDHVTQAIALANKHNIFEVWLTEFGSVGVDSDTENEFLTQALAFLNGNSSVGRYAYFMTGDGTLLNGDALSSLGEVYNG